MSRRKYQLEIALAMTIAFIGALLWKTGMYFEMNDDRAIAEILSGAMTGAPQAHVIHENFFLAVPLTLLYRMTAAVPWYGLLLFGSHALSWFSILYCIMAGAKGPVELLKRIFLCGMILLGSIYIIGLTQFTSTAALLAVAGYLWILLSPNRKVAFALFFPMELLSFFIRRDAMLMVTVMGTAVFVGFRLSHWLSNRKNKEETDKAGKWELGLWFGMVVAILAIGYAGTLAGYSSREWREHSRYDKARSQLFDYYGVPEYEEVRHILDSYGISQREYAGFANYVLIENPVNAECLEALVQYQKEKAGAVISGEGFRENMKNALRADNYYGARALAYVLWIVTALWLVLTKKISLFCPYIGLLFTGLLEWGYLCYQGRMPNRVTMSLLLAEMVFLMAIIVQSGFLQGTSVPRQICYVLLLAVMARYACATGLMQYREVCDKNRGQKIYIEGRKEIKEYCSRDKEKRYLLDAGSFSHYKGSIFETEIYGPQNSIYTGNWYGKSPAMTKYAAEYLQGHEKDFYVIVYDDGEDLDKQAQYPAAAYFAEKTGAEPQLADRFAASHGGAYLVWYFGKGQ